MNPFHLPPLHPRAPTLPSADLGRCLLLALFLFLLPTTLAIAQESSQGAAGAASPVASVDGEAATTAGNEEDGEDGEDEDTLERPLFEQELQVTATALPQPTAQAVSGATLVQGAGPDAAENLRGVAGLGAIRRGGLNLDPQVRGLSETQVAVLVDGTRTFAAGPARMDSGMSHVNPHAVDTVQVVKGPYALTWGAGALSAVRLNTRRPPFNQDGAGWGGEAGLRASDNAGLRDGDVSLYASTPRLRASLLVGRREGGDYQSGSGDRVQAGFTSTETKLHFGWQAKDGLLLELDGGYQDQKDIEYAGRVLDASYFKTRSYAGSFAWTPDGDGVDLVEGKLYSNRKDHLMNNDDKPTARPAPGRIPPFGLLVRLPAEANTSGGRIVVSGHSGAIGWTAGADHYLLQQTARRTIARRDNGFELFNDLVWPDVELSDTGVFLQSDLLPGGASSGRSALVATVRLDRWTAETGAPASDFFLANVGAPEDRDDTLWNAAVAGRRFFGAGWSGTLGVGRTVRTPTALELYSDRFPSTRFQIAAEFMGDPELDPETAIQSDLGVAYAGARFRLDVDGFFRRLDDFVTVQPDPSLSRRLPLSPTTVFRYVNGSRADVYGAEVRATARFSGTWLGRLDAAWLRGEDRQLDEPLFGIAPPWVGLGVRWSPKGPLQSLWVDLGATWVDEQDRVSQSRLERPTPGYETVSLGAGYTVRERWQLEIGVSNLTDEAYSDHLATLNPFTGRRIEEPGRTFHGRVRVAF